MIFLLLLSHASQVKWHFYCHPIYVQVHLLIAKWKAFFKHINIGRSWWVKCSWITSDENVQLPDIQKGVQQNVCVCGRGGGGCIAKNYHVSRKYLAELLASSSVVDSLTLVKYQNFLKGNILTNINDCGRNVEKALLRTLVLCVIFERVKGQS